MHNTTPAMKTSAADVVLKFYPLKIVKMAHIIFVMGYFYSGTKRPVLHVQAPACSSRGRGEGRGVLRYSAGDHQQSFRALSEQHSWIQWQPEVQKT